MQLKRSLADAHVNCYGVMTILMGEIIWHDDNPTNITNEQILSKTSRTSS